ncbi:MAG: Holliday junction resolvase RuvX [Myxococcota bacterium]
MEREPPGPRLGIDFGTKRMGAAVSDLLGTVRPLETRLRGRFDEDVRWIRDLVAKWDVLEVVVGLPLTEDGTETGATRRARRFVQDLRGALSVPVTEWDELLSSQEADRRMRRDGVKEPQKWRDAYAAAVILDDLLRHRSAMTPRLG